MQFFFKFSLTTTSVFNNTKKQVSERSFKRSCVNAGREASTSFLSETGDSLVCYFPDGVPNTGWYDACIDQLNSTNPKKGILDGASFQILPKRKMLFSKSVPSKILTKDWFNVVLYQPSSLPGYEEYLTHNSTLKLIVNDASCSNGDHANYTTATTVSGSHTSSEVSVKIWKGFNALAPSGSSCLSGDESGPVTLLPIQHGSSGKGIYYFCSARLINSVFEPTFLICSNQSTSTSAYSVYTKTNGDCVNIGGHWHSWSTRCDITLCQTRYASRCPGVGCTFEDGYAIMGYGHCTTDAVSRLGVVTGEGIIFYFFLK